MTNADKLLTSADRQRISQRIAELESHTDAEVVCAVATESGRYDRAESICGLFVGLFALISAQKLATLDDWDVTTALPIGFQVLLVVVGFVAGSLLASYWHGLRRLVVRRTEMETEVNKSVHQIFSQQGIGNTQHRGGLLIFLSLFEHRLEVHCDKAAFEKLGPADLETIRDAVLAKVRSGAISDGLMAGLEQAETLLTAALPHTGDATDTLKNEVLVFHPRP